MKNIANATAVAGITLFEQLDLDRDLRTLVESQITKWFGLELRGRPAAADVKSSERAAPGNRLHIAVRISDRLDYYRMVIEGTAWTGQLHVFASSAEAYDSAFAVAHENLSGFCEDAYLLVMHTPGEGIVSVFDWR